MQQNQELSKEVKRIHRGNAKPQKQILSQDRRRSRPETSGQGSVGSYDSALKLNDLIQQAIFTERFLERRTVMHMNLPVARNLVPQEVIGKDIDRQNPTAHKLSIKQHPKSNNETTYYNQAGLINRSRQSSSALNRSGLSRGPLRESLLQSEHSACFVDPNQQTLGGNVHSDDAPSAKDRLLKAMWPPAPLSADQTSAQNGMY